jgi:hypothetical protein
MKLAKQYWEYDDVEVPENAPFLEKRKLKNI